MSNDDAHLIFANRRQSDPQGVIDDLIGQTSRQGGEIHKRGLAIKMLTADNEALRESLNDALSLIASFPAREPTDDGDRKNEPTGPGWWRLRMRPDGEWIAVQVTESKSGNNLVVWLNDWDDVLLDHPELLGAQWGPRIDMPASATDKPADG